MIALPPTGPSSAKPRLRVMHVLHTLSVGGAECIVLDLARARGDEMELSVVCLDAPGPLADEAARLGIEVCCTRRAAGLDWRQVRRLAGHIRRIRPDVIHAHQYTPYFYAALAASYAGFGRILCTEHGRHWPDVVSWPRQTLNQLLRMRRDRFTAVCRFTAAALRRNERLTGRDVTVIPNGVRCAAFDRPARREWLRDLIGAPHDAVVLLHVGRFHPVKDHATAVRAFACTRRAAPSGRLVLVGDGPGREGIERLIAELNLADAVCLLGLRSDVGDLLASADGFVCSSLSEGASLSILEAMAAGLPVAATRVGGNAELVLAHGPGQTGLLSPRGDAEALGANLTALLTDAGLRRRLGQAARRRARALFDQHLMHDRFMRLYRQLAGEGR